MAQHQANTAITGIVCGRRRLSHSAFEDAVQRAAAGLRSLGVAAGDSVALFLRNDLSFLIASRAAAWLGAFAVPVNWHLTAEELNYILADCDARVLLVHADLWRRVRADIAPPVRCILVATPAETREAFALDADECGVPPRETSWDRWLQDNDPIAEPPRLGPSSMIYTSGTTGRPKGVRRAPPSPQAAAIGRDFRARVYGCAEHKRCIVPGPLYHSAPNRYALQAASIGALVVVMPRFEPETFLRLIDTYALTGAMMVPIMFIRLLKLDKARRDAYDLSSLEYVIHAAAPCPPEVKKQMIDWFGPVIHEFYGSTESGAVTVCDSRQALERPGTVGKAVPEADLRILDSQGNRLAQGEVGEIYSRFPMMDFTYNKRPEARAEVEIDGYITSGDIGYLDDAGYLFLADRAKDMIISGGVNIYPAEIESVLHQYSGVKDCAVFGVPDAEFGEAVIAVIEPDDDPPTSAGAIQRYLRERLAGYKLPRRIEFRRDLPREDSGKIFKRRLRETYWQTEERRI